MNIFKKHKGNNRLLKLYRAVSQKQAETFDTKSLIEFVLSEFETWNLELNDFYVTGPYPNDGWKTKKGFLNGLNKRNYKNIHHLMIFDSENKFFLNFQNFSHNRTIEVDSDSIVFEIMLDECVLTEQELILFSERIYLLFNFEYGYIIEQTKGLSIDEGKIKNGFFSYSVKQNPIFNRWSKYQSATKHGFMRSIFQVNYLSPQHLNNETLKNIIMSSGKIENKESFFIWTLSPNEVSKVLELLKNSEFLVDNEEFDKTEIYVHINNEIKKYAPQYNFKNLKVKL